MINISFLILWALQIKNGICSLETLFGSWLRNELKLRTKPFFNISSSVEICDFHNLKRYCTVVLSSNDPTKNDPTRTGKPDIYSSWNYHHEKHYMQLCLQRKYRSGIVKPPNEDGGSLSLGWWRTTKKKWELRAAASTFLSPWNTSPEW